MTVSSPMSQANGEPAAIAPPTIQMPKAMIPNEIRNENASFMMTSIPKKSVSLKPAYGKQKDRSRAHASHCDLLALVCCLFIRFSRVFVGNVAKTLRGDGVVDATGETAACSALSLTPQWWPASKSSPTSNATVTWSDSSSLSARNSQASAADRSFLRWRLSCVACVIFSLAFARHSAAVFICVSSLILPFQPNFLDLRGGTENDLVKIAQ